MDKNFDEDQAMELMKELTIQDFREIGLNQVAYVKRVHKDSELEETFAVHAADGSQISVMDSYASAIATIRINDLYPVTVH